MDPLYFSSSLDPQSVHFVDSQAAADFYAAQNPAIQQDSRAFTSEQWKHRLSSQMELFRNKIRKQPFQNTRHHSPQSDSDNASAHLHPYHTRNFVTSATHWKAEYEAQRTKDITNSHLDGATGTNDTPSQQRQQFHWNGDISSLFLKPNPDAPMNPAARFAVQQEPPAHSFQKRTTFASESHSVDHLTHSTNTLLETISDVRQQSHFSTSSPSFDPSDVPFWNLTIVIAPDAEKDSFPCTMTDPCTPNITASLDNICCSTTSDSFCEVILTSSESSNQPWPHFPVLAFPLSVQSNLSSPSECHIFFTSNNKSVQVDQIDIYPIQHSATYTPQHHFHLYNTTLVHSFSLSASHLISMHINQVMCPAGQCHFSLTSIHELIEVRQFSTHLSSAQPPTHNDLFSFQLTHEHTNISISECFFVVEGIDDATFFPTDMQRMILVSTLPHLPRSGHVRMSNVFIGTRENTPSVQTALFRSDNAKTVEIDHVVADSIFVRTDMSFLFTNYTETTTLRSIESGHVWFQSFAYITVISGKHGSHPGTDVTLIDVHIDQLQSAESTQVLYVWADSLLSQNCSFANVRIHNSEDASQYVAAFKIEIDNVSDLPEKLCLIEGLRCVGLTETACLSVHGYRDEDFIVHIRNSLFQQIYYQFGSAINIFPNPEATLTAKIHVDNSQFLYNHAARLGGAIWCFMCVTLEVHNSQFLQNSAAVSGGAISFGWESLNLEINDCLFERNSIASFKPNEGVVDSATRGGAIQVELSRFNTRHRVSNCVFRDNESLGQGGHVQYHGQGSITFSNTQFTGGVSFEGGAIYLEGLFHGYSSSHYFRDCVFRQNFAVYGAGLFLNATKSTLFFCEFRHNSCVEQGGAIYASGIGSIDINFSDFVGNQAYLGGAMFADMPVNMARSRFLYNMGYVGAAIHFDSTLNPLVFRQSRGACDPSTDAEPDYDLPSCIVRITNNTAFGYGGGITLPAHAKVTSRSKDAVVLKHNRALLGQQMFLTSPGNYSNFPFIVDMSTSSPVATVPSTLTVTSISTDSRSFDEKEILRGEARIFPRQRFNVTVYVTDFFGREITSMERTTARILSSSSIEWVGDSSRRSLYFYNTIAFQDLQFDGNPEEKVYFNITLSSPYMEITTTIYFVIADCGVGFEISDPQYATYPTCLPCGRGYYSIQAGGTCHKCQVGEDCSLGGSLIKTQKGYWSYIVDHQYETLMCPNSRCIGGAPSQCSSNFNGDYPLCQVCEEEYALWGVSCLSCRTGFNFLPFALYLFYSLTVCIYLHLSSQNPKRGASLKILILFTQTHFIVSGFTSRVAELDGVIPLMIASVMSWLQSLFSFSFISSTGSTGHSMEWLTGCPWYVTGWSIFFSRLLQALMPLLLLMCLATQSVTVGLLLRFLWRHFVKDWVHRAWEKPLNWSKGGERKSPETQLDDFEDHNLEEDQSDTEHEQELEKVEPSHHQTLADSTVLAPLSFTSLANVATDSLDILPADASSESSQESAQPAQKTLKRKVAKSSGTMLRTPYLSPLSQLRGYIAQLLFQPQTFIRTGINLFIFTFQPMAKIVMDFLLCYKSPSGDYHMLYQTNIKCYDSAYWMQFIFYVVILGGYLILTPVIILAILAWNRKSLSSPKMMNTLGPFYAHYKPKFWYGEIVPLLRRILLVTADGLAILFRIYGLPNLDTMFFAVILSVQTIYQIRFKPYRRSSENTMERYSLVVLLMLTALRPRSFSNDGVTDQVSLIFGLVIGAITIVWMWIWTIFSVPQVKGLLKSILNWVTFHVRRHRRLKRRRQYVQSLELDEPLL